MPSATVLLHTNVNAYAVSAFTFTFVGEWVEGGQGRWQQ